MYKMQFLVTSFPRHRFLSTSSYETTCLATCYNKKTQIFIFIVSQTSEVLFIKQNCRYLLWLVAKPFPSKGWRASESTHSLKTPLKSATTVFSCSSHTEQVETILNAHFQKICTKRMIKMFDVASKQCNNKGMFWVNLLAPIPEGFKMQLPFCTVTNL